MFKILHSISLPNDVRKFLPDGEFYRPDKYMEYKKLKMIDEIENKSEYENWIETRLKEHKFLNIFKTLFILEMVISILLIIAIIYYYFS